MSNNAVVWDATMLPWAIPKILAQRWQTVCQAELPTKVRKSPRRKIVVVEWWQHKSINPRAELRDLSWADLVVCVTTEVICHGQSSYSDWRSKAQAYFNNENCCFIGGSVRNDIRHKPTVYGAFLHFFHEVVRVNDLEFNDFVGPKDFLFDALLGKCKPERKALVSTLETMGLLSKCLVNIFPNLYYPHERFCYRTPELDSFELPLVQSLFQDCQQSVNTTQNITVPGKSGVWASAIISPEIYQHSWYSIVFETLFSNQPTYSGEMTFFDFLTEKTAKALYSYRIFVLFGAPGSLAKLKSLGFRTFDNVIDERYDSIPNDVERFQAVCKEIKRLSTKDPRKVYALCKTRLEHNRKLMNQIHSLDAGIVDFVKTNLESVLQQCK